MCHAGKLEVLLKHARRGGGGGGGGGGRRGRGGKGRGLRVDSMYVNALKQY